MKVDWIHAHENPVLDPPAGQYFPAVPITLGQVDLGVSVHLDIDTDERYVLCDVQMRPVFVQTDPDPTVVDYDYWAYPWTGWPLLAIIPALYSPEVYDADPDYEGGGKYVEISMVAMEDHTAAGLPGLQSYNRLDLDNPPFYIPDWSLGSGARGGTSSKGGRDDIGDSEVNFDWTFRVVRQRCWTLILIDPAGHRFYYDDNADDPEYGGDLLPNHLLPIVINPDEGGVTPPYSATFVWRSPLQPSPDSITPGDVASTVEIDP